mgnify:CR=1 FL=1
MKLVILWLDTDLVVIYILYLLSLTMSLDGLGIVTVKTLAIGAQVSDRRMCYPSVLAMPL